MKSICIKTNNEKLLNYLLNELNYIEIKPVIISTNKFKNYKNIIIHYSGNETKKFIHEVSCILSCLVIDELEESFIKKLIFKNYFYFDSNERKHIVEMCFDIFTDDFNLYFDKKYNCLINNFESYLKNNKSIVLEPFAGANNIPKLLFDAGYNLQWKCFDIEPPKYNAYPEYKVDRIHSLHISYSALPVQPYPECKH